MNQIIYKCSSPINSAIWTLVITATSFLLPLRFDVILADEHDLADEVHSGPVLTLSGLVSNGSEDDLSTYLESVSDEPWLHEEATKEAILQAVMQRCQIEIILTLKDYGVELSTQHEGTLFHQLAFIDSVDESLECMDTLIQAGFDINAVDKDGHTALIRTLYSHRDGAVTILEGLLSHGADPMIRSDLGLDLLHHALLLRLLYTEVVSDSDDEFSIRAREVIEFAEQVSYLVTRTYSSREN